jgi:hypothetical protein
MLKGNVREMLIFSNGVVLDGLNLRGELIDVTHTYSV